MVHPHMNVIMVPPNTLSTVIKETERCRSFLGDAVAGYGS